jgi:integrase/recombinase XerD
MNKLPIIEIKPGEHISEKHGTFPIELYVNYGGKHKTRKIDTMEQFFLDYWFKRKVSGEKLNSTEWKKAQAKIADYRNRILLIQDLIPEGEFTIDRFFELWFSPDPKDTRTLKGAFETYIEQLHKDSRVGTAISYEQANNSLNKFRPGLLLKDVTKDLLTEYQKAMVKDKKSLTTVGIYLRSLRTILNIAKEKDIITDKEYPFGKSRFIIPKGSNKKKSLTDNQLRAILDYKPAAGSYEERALDYWKFVYLGNGMNPKDMCSLKYQDIKGSRIFFVREKTKHTIKGETKFIEVNYQPELKRIVEKYGTNGKKGDYIFPIFTKDMTEANRKVRVQNFAKVVREGMQKIADDLKIDEKINFMVARHTYSTRLMRSSAPLKYISDSLGHKSLSTTENYLGGFDQKEVEQFSESLTNF